MTNGNIVVANDTTANGVRYTVAGTDGRGLYSGFLDSDAVSPKYSVSGYDAYQVTFLGPNVKVIHNQMVHVGGDDSVTYVTLATQITDTPTKPPG